MNRRTFCCRGLGAVMAALDAPAVRRVDAPTPRRAGTRSQAARRSGAPEPGTVFAWGINGHGQLGDGKPGRKSCVPVRALVLTDVRAVAAGDSSSLALRADGSVWELRGKGGAAPVPGLADGGVVSVAGGGGHYLAARSDGTVWAWGDNPFGQTGVAAPSRRSETPVPVPGLPGGVKAVSAGCFHSLALTGDGSVWAWGLNSHGQLGDSSQVNRAAPARVQGLPPVVAVDAGTTHNLALDAEGTVWAWGQNYHGELGNGRTYLAGPVPAPVADLSTVAAVSAGCAHSLALTRDGTLWGWGSDDSNSHGATASASASGATTAPAPVIVSLPGRVAAACAAQRGSAVLLQDGTVWAWGHNGQGQLGDGTFTDSVVPVPVVGLSHVRAVSGTRQHYLALVGSRAEEGDGDEEVPAAGAAPAGPPASAAQ